MARSVGVTVSAVVVFIGSALTLLCGAMAMVGSLLLMNSHRVPNAPPHLGRLVIIEAVFFFGFGGWGVASGVGLIKTKEWARISMVVFAAILIFFSVPGALFIAFIHLPTPDDPNLPSNFAVALRVGMALFYGMFAALGVFWLYFFNKRSVKEQFRGKQAAFEALPPISGQMSVVTRTPTPSARPLSITIIAWLLLVGSAFGLLSILFFRAIFPTLQMPVCLMGFFLFGPTAVSVLLIWMAAQATAAVGLLKLKNWGRLGTIALQCLGILNAVLLAGVPANRLRFQQFMDSMNASMNANMPQPAPFVFPVWIGMVASLPVFVVILWFLVTRKQAFIPAAHPARQF